MRDSKRATRLITVAADLALAELRAEAYAERHAIDDDCLPAPDPMASAQAKRAAVVGVAP